MGRIEELSPDENGRKSGQARGRNHLSRGKARGRNHLARGKARGRNHLGHGEETTCPALFRRRHRGDFRHTLEELLINIEEILFKDKKHGGALFRPALLTARPTFGQEKTKTKPKKKPRRNLHLGGQTMAGRRESAAVQVIPGRRRIVKGEIRKAKTKDEGRTLAADPRAVIDLSERFFEPDCLAAGGAAILGGGKSQ